MQFDELRVEYKRASLADVWPSERPISTPAYYCSLSKWDSVGGDSPNETCSSVDTDMSEKMNGSAKE